jgi:hypothetical protein
LIHFCTVLKNLGFCSLPNLFSQIYFYCLGSAATVGVGLDFGCSVQLPLGSAIQFIFSLDLNPAPFAPVLGPCCVCARSVSPVSFLDLVFLSGSVSGASLQLPTVFLSSGLRDSFCLLCLSEPVKLTSWIWA